MLIIWIFIYHHQENKCQPCHLIIFFWHFQFLENKIFWTPFNPLPLRFRKGAITTQLGTVVSHAMKKPSCNVPCDSPLSGVASCPVGIKVQTVATQQKPRTYQQLNRKPVAMSHNRFQPVQDSNQPESLSPAVYWPGCCHCTALHISCYHP